MRTRHIAAVAAAGVVATGGLLFATGTAQAAEDYAAGWPTIAPGAGGAHINVNVVADGDWQHHDRSNPQSIALSTDYDLRIRVENFTYADLWAPALTSNGFPEGGRNLRCDFSPFGGPVGVASWPEGKIPHGGVVYCMATQLGRLDAGTVYSDYRMDGLIRPAGGDPYAKWGADWWWGEVEARPSIDIEKWSTADGLEDGDFDVAPGKDVVPGAASAITMTITNTGNETLMFPIVTDETLDGQAMFDLECDFTPIGGNAQTTRGPVEFAPGASFTCTGTVPALADGEHHADTATVTAWSNSQLDYVSDEDDWHGTGHIPATQTEPDDDSTTPTDDATVPRDLPTPRESTTPVDAARPSTGGAATAPTLAVARSASPASTATAQGHGTLARTGAGIVVAAGAGLTLVGLGVGVLAIRRRVAAGR